jgi:prepilin-type processing-associated H-X9-DG protein
MSPEADGVSTLGPAAPRLSTAAVAAFVLGLLSLGLSLLAALPALYVGFRGLRAVNESDGRLRGRGLAVAGMALAGLTTLLTTLGTAAVVLIHLQSKSDRAACANNLREVGLAVNVYCDQNDFDFPQATVPNPRLPPERRLSWLAAVGPFLGSAPGAPAEPTAGRRQTFAALGFEQAWDAPTNATAGQANVAAFLCPTFVRDYRPGPGLTSYVGLAGIDPDAASLPENSPRAGFFGYDRTLSWLDLPAGTSTTMMATETTRDNGPWAAGGPPTVRGLDPERTRYIGYGQPFGGLHPGGLNVLWADASVRFVTEDVSPAHFRAQALLRRPGGE